MRLKNLTLCLLGLSLSACSMHAIQSNQTTVSLDQKATQGLNAIYSTPSFDFNGQFKLDFAAETAQQKQSKQQTLEPQLEKQLEAYLNAQNVKLTKQQKQDLYQAIAQEKDADYAYSGTGSTDKFQDFLGNILSNIQFSYDGSVHYRDQIGSLNLTAKYDKPNLSVQTKVPMVLDFKNSKFYVNYFGIMPFMVNSQSQDSLTYFDFSKFKGDLDKIDMKNLVDYLKANTAIPFVLAEPEQLKSLSISSQEKAQGVVEKIRLTSSIEELFLQQRLFEAVNLSFMTNSIVDVEKLVNDNTKSAVSKAAVERDEDEEYVRYATSEMSTAGAEAYRESIKLYRLVNEHLGGDDARDSDDEAYVEDSAADNAADNYAEASAEASNAYAAAAEAAAGGADEYDSAADSASAEEAYGVSEEALSATDDGLTEPQCDALRQQTGRSKLGDVTYCEDNYGIGLLNSAAPSEDNNNPFAAFISDEHEALVQKFQSYGSEKLTDAVAFKQLWNQHSDEIKQLLAKHKSNVYVADIGLDAQGRAVVTDYDLSFNVEKFGQMNLKSETNIFNYGKATAISQRQLKDAKSVEEASKGSMLESIVERMSTAFGIASTEAVAEKSKVKSISQQLDDVAAQVYDATGSYSKAYEAVYALKLSLEHAQIVEYYTPRELNEIARVYAYSFADQSVYHPKGKQLAELEALMVKHQLQSRRQYDTEIGTDVYEVVIEAMDQRKQRLEWQKLVKQYKQPKAIFVQAYMQQFLEEQTLDAQEKVQLKATAEVLAQAYADSRQNKLSKKSIQRLSQGAEEYIDYDLYSSLYEKLLVQFK